MRQSSPATQWLLTAASVLLFAGIGWWLGIRPVVALIASTVGYGVGMALLTRYWMRGKDAAPPGV